MIAWTFREMRPRARYFRSLRTLQAQLKAYQTGYEKPGEGRYTDGEAKVMRSNAFGLSDLEIKAVASYIAGLQ